MLKIKYFLQESYGFKMRLLNVGGGIPTDQNSLEFREVRKLKIKIP